MVGTNLLRFGRFELDPANFQLRRSGRPVRLERIPLEVLLLLVERRAQLVRRQDIADSVWGRDVVLDVDNALNTAIRKVRRALGDNPDHPRYVETVAAKGYRFIGAVTSMPRVDTEGVGGSDFAKVNSLLVPSSSDSAEQSIGNVSAPKGLVEGERKQVTALVAHLKGSMEWLGDGDPEEQRELIDPVLHRVIEAVHSYEGTVNQVTQDGILALFGAPLAHEDHAIRACYAALRMQEAVTNYVAEVSGLEDGAIQVGIGLNTGEMVIRGANAEQPLEPLGVGHTTHLAARLAQLAPSGAVLATANMLRLVDGYVRFTSLGQTVVEGLSRAVDVYQLTERGAIRSQLQAAAARGFSKFVGRDIEMMQLQRALEQTRNGRGQAVAIVGDPGVGKSRVAFELTHSHDVRSWLVLEARSVSYGKGTAFLPIIDLLKSYFAVGDRDTPDDIQKNVAEKIIALDRALEPMLPALLALLDVPVYDCQWQELDAPQRRQRTMDAVKCILLREAQVRPVLVILEDLHWIDSESQALLDSFIESLPATRLLLLVNYRPEYRHDWGSKTFYTQLRLDTLSPGSTRELLDVLLGPRESLQPLKALLAGTTEGNPFFIEESVRTLVETKALLGERGAHDLAHPVEMIQVPATVQAVLAARIDRLPPEEKRILEIAAVIGKDFPLALLQAVEDETEETLRRALGHLTTAEFLYERNLLPDLEYTFKHSLTHEVAYRSLLRDRRRDLHARIVEAMERLYADRLAEHVERLAHHSLRGERWESAARYLWQAGTKMMERSALRDAITRFEDALAALRHLPETRVVLENAFDIRLDLRLTLNQLGELPRVLTVLREAEQIADKLDDNRRRGRVYWAMVNTHNLRSELDAALAVGARALQIADALGEVGLRVATTTALEQTHFYRGEYEEVVALARRNLDLAERLPADRSVRTSAPAAVFDRHWLLRSLTQLGRFTETTELADTVIPLAERTQLPIAQALALFAVGTVHMWKGDWGRARSLHERAARILQEGDQVLQLSYVIGPLAWALAGQGETEEAASRASDAEQRLDHIRLLGRKGGGAETYISLCHCYLILQRLDDADRMVARALEDGTAASEAQALQLQAEIAMHPGRRQPKTAEDCYQRALALAEPRGMRPLVAHCHLGLGKLYRRTGRQQALEQLIIATTLYRAMDMGFWLKQAEAEMKAPS